MPVIRKSSMTCLCPQKIAPYDCQNLNLRLTKRGGFFNPQRTMGGFLDSVSIDGWLCRQTCPAEQFCRKTSNRARALN